jgi:DNA polymerase III epsilon subunit-like protein
MIFFFDTETTGIPRNYRAPVSELDNWPRMVQIAWILAEEDGGEVAQAEYILRPDGYTIPPDAAKIHGITTEIARERGRDLAEVLREAEAAIGRATTLVAHNLEFDEKILGAEFLRRGFPNGLESKWRVCTMQSSTDFCRLPGRYGFKWPTLQELHGILFGEPMEGAHRALSDVRACARCYGELKRKGLV